MSEVKLRPYIMERLRTIDVYKRQVLAGILIIIFKLMAEYDTDKLEYDKIDSLGGIDLID